MIHNPTNITKHSVLLTTNDILPFQTQILNEVSTVMPLKLSEDPRAFLLKCKSSKLTIILFIWSNIKNSIGRHYQKKVYPPYVIEVYIIGVEGRHLSELFQKMYTSMKLL